MKYKIILVITGLLLALICSYFRIYRNSQLVYFFNFTSYLIAGVLIAKRNVSYSLLFLVPISLTTILGFIVNWHAALFFAGEMIAAFVGFYCGVFVGKKSFKKFIYLFVISLAILSFLLYYLMPKMFLSRSISQFEIKQSDKKSIPQLFGDSAHLVNAKNEILSLKKLSGKIILIDFWFKNCMPCNLKHEPLFVLTEQYKNDTSVVILSINNGGIDSFETFKNFVSNNKFLNNSWYDKNGVLSEFYKQNFELKGHPTEYIFDKNGNLRYKMEGFDMNMLSLYVSNQKDLINHLKIESNLLK